ncbi:hypothetical protein L0665_00635 [Methanogenium marinum]|uniref:ATP-binding protein n=1 Tax=Methanogenium marinum TaxID=348610 RepID=A0A9Q4PV18_9EURY|nr:hypothetical protein [Methanogenium marinum]MDE4907134.1 hypothetical protein [Methanogenium marinum]
MEDKNTNGFGVDIKGIVRNLKLSEGEALLPLFEAVVNSIQSIEESGNLTEGEITITILRDIEQKRLEADRSEFPIVGFEIEDNGVGFNYKNFESFTTAYTSYKYDKGCKGVGRFLWLKTFDHINIDSTYVQKDTVYSRQFNFNITGIDNEEELISENGELRTIITLNNFNEEYRLKDSAYKKTKTIARRILEYCLSYYINNSAPKIIVQDMKGVEGREKYDLNSEYQIIKDHIEYEDLNWKEHSFKLTHVRLYDSTRQMHKIVYCADNRDVLEENLNKLLGTDLSDSDNKKYIYAAYVSGQYLNDHVSLTRINFDIPDQRRLDTPLDEPSLEELKNTITDAVKAHLKDIVDEVIIRKKDLIEKYVAEENPTLRTVVKYCSDNIIEDISIDINKEKLNQVLYSYKASIEQKLHDDNQRILGKRAEGLKNLDDDIPELLESVNKDDLAGYIIHRKMLLDYIEKSLYSDENGKFCREDILHDAIFPRNATSDDIPEDTQNLWVIDDRLAFHAYASSDMIVDTIDTKSSNERPDVLVCSNLDDNRIARTVTILEFKRPQRKNLDESPTKQIYRYIRRINDKTFPNKPNSRPISTDEKTQYYCYVICDITKKIIEDVTESSFTQLSGELGYYTYNKNYNAHVEILSYDKLIADARKRNKMFFIKLGIEQ